MHLLRIKVAEKLRQQVSCCLCLVNSTKPHRKVGFYASFKNQSGSETAKAGFLLSVFG